MSVIRGIVRALILMGAFVLSFVLWMRAAWIIAGLTEGDWMLHVGAGFGCLAAVGVGIDNWVKELEEQ